MQDSLWLVLGVLTLVPLLLCSHPVRVSENQRHLVDASGQPFFWLADTAWELLHRLDDAESRHYLETRAQQGFTVILTVALAELEGLSVPNAEGELPLIDQDPARPNDAYFAHVDQVLGIARELGLTVGLLPTWGDKWNLKWGPGPEVFTPENARLYGMYLGERYREAGIVWVLGGDRNPVDDEDRAITHALAEGLAAGDGGRHLMTFHPQGGFSSSAFFQEAPWLDFHLFQSGHAPSIVPNYKQTRADYALTPTRPTLDGEPMYEDHPIDWKPERGRFTAFDVRRAAYGSMLSGAAGHTYGHHSIWQMWEPPRKPISAAHTPWREALGWPGAIQMGHLRALFTARDWWGLVPAQQRLVSGPKRGRQEILVAADAPGGLLIAYTPYGSDFQLDLDGLMAEGTAQCWWFNPREGTSLEPFDVPKDAAFDPPDYPGPRNDWVLVIDGVRGRPMPGTRLSGN